MWKQLREACSIFVLLTLVTGVFYPLVVTAAARMFFADRAAGSIIRLDGRRIGSEFIGQSFTNPRYFWGRPSATSPVPYNASAGSGSNFGPTNPALVEAVQARIVALQAADPDIRSPVPIDLVTTSGSGLDPHISPAAAYYQLGRVAKARALGVDMVRELVERHIDQPTLGVFGTARVNVLRLNLALDALQP